MCKCTPWPCKWTVTVHICTVTVHLVNDFFFSLSSLNRWLTLLSFSHFLYHLTFTDQLSLKADQLLWSNTAVISTNYDSNQPLSSLITWKRPAFLADHDLTIQGLDLVNTGDFDRFVLFDRWWWLVAGCGWFWVCVGSAAWQRRRWLTGCGWFCWRMGVGVPHGFCWRVAS